MVLSAAFLEKKVNKHRGANSRKFGNSIFLKKQYLFRDSRSPSWAPGDSYANPRLRLWLAQLLRILPTPRVLYQAMQTQEKRFLLLL